MKVIYKQEWSEGFDFADILFQQSGLFKEGGPEVFIYNAGAPAHKGIDPIEFAKWWKSRVSAAGAVIPKVLIFLLPPTIQGQRNYFWSKVSTDVNVEKLERIVKNLGFSVLRMDQLSIGWDVSTTGNQDGFHYGFNALSMGSMIVVNMICNIGADDFQKGNFYTIGAKLDVQYNADGLMYEYKRVTIEGEDGDSFDAIVPHPTLKEKFERDGILINPCNCFDKGRMIPYNLVDTNKFELF